MEPLGPAGHAAARFSPVGFARAPVSYLLSYAGVLRQPPRHASADVEVGGGSVGGRGGEVSIRIVGGGEREEPAAAGEGPPRQHLAVGYRRQRSNGMGIEQMEQIPLASNERVGGDGVIGSAGEGGSSSSSSVSPSSGVGGEAEVGGEATGGSDTSYQRYDVQQAAKWIEHALPFSLLLMLVFIRQHLQGNDEIYNVIDKTEKEQKLDLDKERAYRTPEEMVAEVAAYGALFS